MSEKILKRVCKKAQVPEIVEILVNKLSLPDFDLAPKIRSSLI